nr:MAG TPA: hypothetical protein [Caudoviricetes sp.]
MSNSALITLFCTALRLVSDKDSSNCVVGEE